MKKLGFYFSWYLRRWSYLLRLFEVYLADARAVRRYVLVSGGWEAAPPYLPAGVLGEGT